MRRISRRVGASGVKRGSGKTRVCVLSSSYDGISSPTSEVDNFVCTPQPWLKRDAAQYDFAIENVKKASSFRHVRELVSSGKYDVFYNLCDGAKDEERAGEDVVRALEDLNAAYTGSASNGFEVNKVDMKVLVAGAGIRTPNFVMLDSTKNLVKRCHHLKFPVIVKHMSGYASVGITKDSKCSNVRQLAAQCRKFIKEFDHALVEEFVVGAEGTVLVCADPKSPSGIKVFPPIMLSFLTDPNDFAHFDNKWKNDWVYQKTPLMTEDDPALPDVIDMARGAFKYIMNGVGYGRVDFRVDQATGKPYFLEINANCGMLYHPETGGDYADVMVQSDKDWTHDDFVRNAIELAREQQMLREPWHCISHDARGHFAARATKNVKIGTPLFHDGEQAPPVVARALSKVGLKETGAVVSSDEVGCVISRSDSSRQIVVLRHSCDPNMVLMHGQTLTLNAHRHIQEGEELTIDYGTLRDPSMPSFKCACGAAACRGEIVAGIPLPRTRHVALPASSAPLKTVAGRELRKQLAQLYHARHPELHPSAALRRGTAKVVAKAAASRGDDDSSSSSSSSGSGSGGGGRPAASATASNPAKAASGSSSGLGAARVVGVASGRARRDIGEEPRGVVRLRPLSPPTATATEDVRASEADVAHAARA